MSKPSIVDRRQFITRSMALGCSAAASPFLTPVSLAAAPWDARLVVIILRGAMDGLEVVRPQGDPEYGLLRPSLSKETGAMGLDNFYTMTRHLKALVPFWRQGELAFAQAVATPYRDKRSHFEGQDLLEAGIGQDVELGYQRDGWLNRMIGAVPGATLETAFAVGREDLFVLSGNNPVSSWSPDARMDLSEQGKRLLEALYHDDPVFQNVGGQALDLVSLLDLDQSGLNGKKNEQMMDNMVQSMGQANRASRAKALAKFSAERLNDATRIAAFSISGWDTHRRQSNRIGMPLRELSDAIITLKKKLGKNWEKTAVVAVTEFGRSARENGSQGTDHGTGGALLMAGGTIRGGKVYGAWPGLGEGQLYADRDLKPTSDVRSYIAYLMQGLFGLEKSLLETSIFPGLDMGPNPKVLL